MTAIELVWDEACVLGVPEIDADHRRLHAIYTALRSSLEGRSGPVDLQALCGDLLDFARDHFANEEALMAARGYPELEAHRKMHATFLEQVGDIGRFLREQSGPGGGPGAGSGGEADDELGRFVVMGFVGKWLKMHTMVADRSFAEWLTLPGRRGPGEGEPAYAAAVSAST